MSNKNSRVPLPVSSATGRGFRTGHPISTPGPGLGPNRHLPLTTGPKQKGSASANVQHACIYVLRGRITEPGQAIAGLICRIKPMSLRVRQSVQCPKCLTLYLIASSPYRNGSYIIPAAPYSSEVYILYCSCGKPAVSTWWRWSELKSCKVSTSAHDRGYGTPQEIVLTHSDSPRKPGARPSQ